MIRNLNYQNETKTLYLIPTPIGNLSDITLRALDTLKQVDKLYAEDTRVTLKLLRHYDIKKTVISLHEHNESAKVDLILDDLKQGRNIGIVSDAGMPLVSDPGAIVVKETMKAGFNVVALPGANALLPALVMSGIQTHPFLFYGFLDVKATKRRASLEDLRYQKETLIFYEAIHRIEQTLADMYDILGNRNFVIAREISKSYEEIIRGTLSEYEQVGELKGELVIVIEGYQETQAKSNLSIVDQVDYFLESGMKKTEAMKRVSEMTGIPKNKIYQDYLNQTIKKG
ncbi:MAG: 16S rRNA (cytidine(1402)-2'-O)-methyltransferase [Bacilli bacterium]|nr:16S rRNA (cytidine(1402)-2'-O)-methyltransferase [Bacilli bacterium]MBN2876990.1 16S rRNA (cytidine(1402)-2'-O)-methyltransferase [Bacilli bacterium]